ncbi:MAG: hypothetical protein WBP93_21690 [Pyrinomonadaceae bacterium]
MLDVKQATKAASDYFASLVEPQTVSDIRLEEVEIEQEEPEADTFRTYWLITLSYLPAKPNPLLPAEQERQYKVFKIDAETGELMSMKMLKVA